MASFAPEGFDPVEYINRPDWHTSRMGLDRIRTLMQRLGDPQKRMRIVHVAGTNGKGSTCAFTAQILQEAGYCTGLFTSPYVIEFSERIRVNGVNIPADDLLEVTLEVREQAEAMDDHPTEFELMTAVAFVHFARQACDVAVVEVGLGGRLDSTNVVPPPVVCAITPVALDHTDLLGSTLAEIAAEKAGIIKSGAVVAMGVQQPEARAVIEQRAAACGCSVVSVDEQAIQGTPKQFGYKHVHDVVLRLQGSYQIYNAALALEIADALQTQGFAIRPEHLKAGLQNTRWPARFELVANNPAFIVDGGHNPQGAEALASSLLQSYPDARPVFLMGVLADKDYPGMLDVVVPLAAAFVCVKPPSPRALPADKLASAIAEACERCGISGVPTLVASGMSQGVQLAREQAGSEGLVCAFGSLYSVADIMAAL